MTERAAANERPHTVHDDASYAAFAGEGWWVQLDDIVHARAPAVQAGRRFDYHIGPNRRSAPPTQAAEGGGLCLMRPRMARIASSSTRATGRQPPHVHVQREHRVGKFWLDPVRLERRGRFDSLGDYTGSRGSSNGIRHT